MVGFGVAAAVPGVPGAGIQGNSAVSAAAAAAAAAVPAPAPAGGSGDAAEAWAAPSFTLGKIPETVPPQAACV